MGHSRHFEGLPMTSGLPRKNRTSSVPVGMSQKCQYQSRPACQGFRARPIMFSVRPTHCAATVIYPRSICGRPKGSAAPIPVRNRSCCRAIKTHATKRSIVFLCAKGCFFDRVYFIAGGRALDRGQRMLELWNDWYDTLASVEALATVIVIVLVAAGAITLAESRRR